MNNIQPWQRDVLEKISSGGVKPGELMSPYAGRNIGKNYMQMYYKQMYLNHPVPDIKLTTGTVYGSRYYVAAPVGGNWVDMEEWCVQTFGETTGSIWAERAPEPAQRWYMNNQKFWFRKESDRTMFVLKWS